MSCCGIFLYEPLCGIYDEMKEEYVLHLTFVLLCKDCFGPSISGS